MRRILPVLLLVLCAGPALPQTATRVVHAIAMHGEPKYGPDFRNFDYVNPSAPRAGDVRFGAIGTFDSFNPFILRGLPAAAVSLTFEALTVGSNDEPFTRYCLICETMEIPEDRSWITFNLRPQARFHDGSPITPDDVIWTFQTLIQSGHPRFRSYYADVERVERVGERGVRFTFRGTENREMPLIIGELPILSRAYWANRDFSRTTLEAPLGSGPYRIESHEAGRFVVLRRVDNWSRGLPVNVGRFNFETIRYDYYREPNVALEAFKAGEYDIRQENRAQAWAQSYDSPARAQGLYRLEEIPEQRTSGMQAFGMNLRRALFRDVALRQAIILAYDFETANRQLFFGAYVRTRSYFDGGELAARGLPSPEELEILNRFRGRVPEQVFTAEYNPPRTPGTGPEGWRDNRREATQILTRAGYRVQNNRLMTPQGQPVTFEIMLVAGDGFERIALPFVQNLRTLGIEVTIRNVDVAQYQRRFDEFDYDMAVFVFGQSESPGNEQRDYWRGDRAAVPGSSNYAGIADPAIDELVELVVAAPSREALVARTRALDRVLQWSHYMVPNWHTAVDRVAFWDRFARPSVTPRSGFDWTVWWVDPARDAALRARRGR